MDIDRHIKVNFTITIENYRKLHTGYISSEILESKCEGGQTPMEYLETCTGMQKLRLSSIVLCAGGILKSRWNVEDLLDTLLI